MPVTEIYLLRHGHRLAWTLDPTTGKYTSNHPYPTRLPADPPLASHGVRQAQETGSHLSSALETVARQDRLRIYSSLFYRCLETLRPTVEGLRSKIEAPSSFPSTGDKERLLRNLEVRGERGVGEWFGQAWFEQPAPADAARLKTEFFPWLDAEYQVKLVPDIHGERIEALHERVARALTMVIESVDTEFAEAGRRNEEVTLLICGHAAQIIASGRALTGFMPDDTDEEDFKCFTCGLSKFTRRKAGEPAAAALGPKSLETDPNWKDGRGVAGGWDCILNSDCNHLSQGEERGWHFHGDESFDSYGAASSRGPITSDGGVHASSPFAVSDSNETSSKL